MTEWRPSFLFPEYYEVSDDGQVRSRIREVACCLKTGSGKGSGTRTTRTRGGKLMAISYGGRTKTYPRVHLRPGSKAKLVWIAVHVLVCSTFHGPRPDGKLCCHRDDNPTNNRADNLYWGTREENEADRARNSAEFRITPQNSAEFRITPQNSAADAGADVELAGANW